MNRQDKRTFEKLVIKYGVKKVREELDKMDGGEILGFPVIFVENELPIPTERKITFGDFSCWILTD